MIFEPIYNKDIAKWIILERKDWISVIYRKKKKLWL